VVDLVDEIDERGDRIERGMAMAGGLDLQGGNAGRW